MSKWAYLGSPFPTAPQAPIPSGFGYTIASMTKAQMCAAEWMWQTLQLTCSGTIEVTIPGAGVGGADLTGTANFDAGTNAFATPDLTTDWRGVIGVARAFNINYTQIIPGFLPFPYDSDWNVQFQASWTGPIYYNEPYDEHDGTMFTKLLGATVSAGTLFNTMPAEGDSASGSPDATGGDFTALLLGNSLPGKVINGTFTTLTVAVMSLDAIANLPPPPDF